MAFDPFDAGAAFVPKVLRVLRLIRLGGWTTRDGQFSDFEAGAQSIFDADEPEEVVTDGFPESAGEKVGEGRQR